MLPLRLRPPLSPFPAVPQGRGAEGLGEVGGKRCNETLLSQQVSLFNGTITASCQEQLFNLVSICYNQQHYKNCHEFKAAVLKVFSAKRPFKGFKTQATEGLIGSCLKNLRQRCGICRTRMS